MNIKKGVRSLVASTFALLVVLNYQGCGQAYDIEKAPLIDIAVMQTPQNSNIDANNELGEYSDFTPPTLPGQGDTRVNNPFENNPVVAAPEVPNNDMQIDEEVVMDTQPVQGPQQEASVEQPEQELQQEPPIEQIEQPEQPIADQNIEPVLACGVDFIKNGDFESIDDRVGISNKQKLSSLVKSGKPWDVFESLPGSQEGLQDTSWIATDGTSGIEVQANHIVKAASGNHYVELDSHANSKRGNVTNSGMYQLIHLSAAGELKLSFKYRGRTEYADDNRIEILINGVVVGSVAEAVYGAWGSASAWKLIEMNVNLNAGLNRVEFRAAGQQNTLGGFLDSISLSSTCK